MLRYIIAVGAVVLLGAALVLACTDVLGPGEPLATTSEALTLTPQTNYPVYGSGRSETSIAAASHLHMNINGGSYPVGNWVVAWNGSQNCGSGCYEGAGWAFSSDLDASAWDANEVLDFGTPTGADGGAVTMSDGYPFFHLRSDPGVAPVRTTPADAGDYNQRILYTMGADSTNSIHSNHAADVAIAISDNGGQTFGHPKLVSDPSTASNGADHPAIATGRVYPYSTWVAWIEPGTSANKIWMRQVSYSDDSNFTFTKGPAIQVDPLGSSGNDPGEPFIDIGQVPGNMLDGGGGLHEAVFVTWVGGYPGRCSGSNTANITWWYSVFDTVIGQFVMQAYPVSSGGETNWPDCIGGLPDGGVAPSSWVATNDPGVRVAAHSDTNLVAFAWISKGSGYGTRMRVQVWRMVFLTSDGGLGSPVLDWTAPSPCNGGCISHCCDTGPDGGPIVNDEWGPAIAFVRNTSTGTDETVWGWYDTRQDKNNIQVTTYGAYYDDTSTSSIVQIGIGTSGQTVPWNYTLDQWWDYQGIQSDLSSFKFLNSWGGDGRNAPPDGGISWYGTGGIYSAVVQ